MRHNLLDKEMKDFEASNSRFELPKINNSHNLVSFLLIISNFLEHNGFKRLQTMEYLSPLNLQNVEPGLLWKLLFYNFLTLKPSNFL